MDIDQQSIFQPIYQYILTTHQADELFVHIDTLFNHLYTIQKDPFDKIAYAVLEPQIAKQIQQIFQERNLQWSHLEEVKSFLVGLKHDIQSFEILTLTLSYQPGDQTIAGFANWARTNLAPRILLEISIDPSLIAGSVAVFRGHYIDVSLKKRLDEVFSKQKDNILHQIRGAQKKSPENSEYSAVQNIRESVHQPTAI